MYIFVWKTNRMVIKIWHKFNFLRIVRNEHVSIDFKCPNNNNNKYILIWCIYKAQCMLRSKLWGINGSTVRPFHRAFTGELVNNKKTGIYRCTVCGKELFLSDAKFDSGSGWPSFWETSKDGSVREISDTSYGMTRTEVTCADVSSVKP